MLISTKGRYALRLLLEMGRHELGTTIPLPVIAEKQDISEKYLEAIVSVLVKGGLIEGTRGKNGGYRLVKDISEYTVGEVLRQTEGTLAPVSCLDKSYGCPRADSCRTMPVWEKLDSLINGYLDSVTLGTLLENGGTPDITRGTLEGDIAPGKVTFYRLQCDSEGVLRSYIAEGEVLPVPTGSFGGIGIIAIPEMGRFYRHVLIQKRYPHHGAVAFAHVGKTLFEVLKYFGISDIAYNQPKSLPYPTENPWA